MKIRDLKLYDCNAVVLRSHTDYNTSHYYVDSLEHFVVVSNLADKVLETQNELIAAYNELIKLKETLGNSISKVQ